MLFRSVVVEAGGRHTIVEYSDLPAAAAAERLPDGRLRFHAGSIAVHCFAREFLARTAAREDSLPLHLAFKAVPFLDAEGVRRVPPAPNAIKFEELKAKPDQLLSYHFWAEDVGPDGNVRRTSSDMYFAEVRHFEEIFRQGQQSPGGQQQQQQQQQNSPAGQQAQQLAQDQKQIINATWKLIRRETGSKPTDALASDVEQLVTAQNALLEKAKALVEIGRAHV